MLMLCNKAMPYFVNRHKYDSVPQYTRAITRLFMSLPCTSRTVISVSPSLARVLAARSAPPICPERRRQDLASAVRARRAPSGGGRSKYPAIIRGCSPAASRKWHRSHSNLQTALEQIRSLLRAAHRDGDDGVSRTAPRAALARLADALGPLADETTQEQAVPADALLQRRRYRAAGDGRCQQISLDIRFAACAIHVPRNSG